MLALLKFLPICSLREKCISVIDNHLKLIGDDEFLI